MYLRNWCQLALLSALLLPSGPSDARTVSREESTTISAEGIRTISFRDMKFTDLVYRGSSSCSEFTIRFEKRASDSSDLEIENILSAIRLDTAVSGGNLTITLRTPKQSESGILDRWFKRKTWRAVVEVAGPSALDMDIDADFSDVRTSATSGVLSFATDFSEVNASDHEGRMRMRTSFGTFNGENIRGSFDVNSNFSHVSLVLGRLYGDSQVSVSFGSGEIEIPKNAGAVFLVTREFSGVTFNTSGLLTYEGEKGSRRVLNGGGPNISLSAKFSDIKVRDNLREYGTVTRTVFRNDQVMPLIEGAWWKYMTDDESMILRIERIRLENGRNIATLSFDRHETSPFGSIEVFENEQGLFLNGITRSFFGKNLSGILMNPPVLWLPYRQEDSPAAGGDIMGTVRITAFMDSVDTPIGRMGDVITYSLEGSGRTVHRLQLVPGVGFISFDRTKLVSYYLSDGEKAAPPLAEHVEPIQEFEKGVIRSVQVGGNRIITEQVILKKLDLREGETYTRAQIDEAIKRIEEEPLIDFASYVVDQEGNLRVRVYEIRPFVKDFGADASFSRVGGFGIGPNLKITSRIGPISEVHGGAEYHWGNKDWTWEAGASRTLFRTRPLTFGAGYRYDFESVMEWAIPKNDAYLNAFILGEEATNYSHVESAYGFISQSFGKKFDGTIRYFEDTYGSVGKETDRSLFNKNRVKEENPPLGPESAVRISGVRLMLTGREVHTITDFRSKIEIERSFRKSERDYPAYTRIIGLASWNLRYWYDNLVKFRIAGGYSNANLPDQKSFRLGGHNTLRGFDSMSIPASPAGQTPFSTFDGGDRMFLANFDYFWGHDLALIFFGDFGGVWRKGEPVTASSLKRDIGIGLALGSDFFSSVAGDEQKAGFRVNWAVPVGNEPHASHWTVNFIREY